MVWYFQPFKNFPQFVVIPDNHDGVITHLEPDILEGKVKWVLEASGSNGIPGVPFKNQKDDAVKLLHSICQQIWKTQQWPQDGKRSVFIPIPKKDIAKECSNYCIIALISHTNKVMLNILQVRLQRYVNHKRPDVQAGFRKGRGTRDQLPTSTGSSKKRVPEEHLLLLHWLLQSLWLCGSQQTVENSERDGNTRSPDLPPEKSVCRSRSNS